MKVSNGVDQINISNNISQAYLGKYTGYIPKYPDTFKRRDNNQDNGAYRVSVPIQSLYSPNQLLRAYLSKDFVDNACKNNPNIKKILAEYGVEYKVNPENVLSIVNTHLIPTKALALQIANQMHLSQTDKSLLETACMLHDIGKIFIPDEIINKPSALTDKEKRIMQLHSQLGYELLLNTGVDKRVLNLIKNHHMNSNENPDILGQILSVADIYSALRENRVYKSPYSKSEAFNVLDQKAENGEVSTEVLNALKRSIYVAA